MLPATSKPWDFSLAHDALKVFPSYLNTTNDIALQALSEYEPPDSPTLGDFGSIFKLLETETVSAETRWLRLGPNDASSASSSDELGIETEKRFHIPPVSDTSAYSTPASSPPEHAANIKDCRASSDVRWKDDVDRAIEIRMRARSRKAVAQSSAPSKIVEKHHDQSVTNHAEFLAVQDRPDRRENAGSNLLSRTSKDQVVNGQQGPKVHFALSTVQQIRSSPSLVIPIDIQPQLIVPLIPQTLSQKQDTLVTKLAQLNGKTSTAMLRHVLEMNIRSDHAPHLSSSQTGIHVFVDSSNTVIGFQNALKRARKMNQNTYVRRPPISFNFLALILERGREVSKRVLVGSSRLGIRPDYMSEAELCGYEVSVLEHVTKMKTKISKTVSRQRRSGYGTSGYSSGSDGRVAMKTVTEQGVDEIIHMKMLESLVDTQHPSTIVLASGDAAEAEYSGGFLKNVVRALEAGWNVEIVAWRNNIGYAYRSHKFLKAWKNQFRIIELDDFCEDLLAVYE